MIWALWHSFDPQRPVCGRSNPAVSAVVFVIGVVADAYLLAYLRLRSGSVWPAVVAHGASNAIVQGTFDRATAGVSWAVGESGLLTALVAIGFVALVTRGFWTRRPQPAERLAPMV
jgi:membrane protease YdiL (CAAX protease family)